MEPQNGKLFQHYSYYYKLNQAVKYRESIIGKKKKKQQYLCYRSFVFL